MCTSVIVCICFVVSGQSEAERLVKDPMYRLEHGVKDKQKAKESVPQIEQLQVLLKTFNFIVA